MAGIVKYFYGTEEQILGLTSESPNWIERAFYYPSDRGFFYQLLDGVMKKYASGTGVTVNGEIIGGIKRIIREDELLDIPEDYEYNAFELSVFGNINCEGNINIL